MCFFHPGHIYHLVCPCFAEQVVKQDYEVIIMVSPALLVLDVRR